MFVALFQSVEETINEIKPPGVSRPVSVKVMPAWSSIEDDALWSLSQNYKLNWALISDALISLRTGTGYERGEWDCYDRYKMLLGQNVKSRSKFDYTYARPYTTVKNTSGDQKMKALSLLNSFELITKCARKREHQRVPCNYHKLRSDSI
jgi:hypothetical protein